MIWSARRRISRATAPTSNPRSCGPGLNTRRTRPTTGHCGNSAQGRVGKCLRGHYKQALANAFLRAGRELARAMDVFRAGKNVPSLKTFVGDLRERLRQVP